METGIEWIIRFGYPAIFLLLMLGIVGLPLPDETLLTFVGYLSSKGTLGLGPTLAVAFLGSACGISVSYGIGRLAGPRIVAKLGPLLHFRAEHLAAAERWVQRWGTYALVIGYFVPGVRHLIAAIAGASHLSPGLFARYAYAGALLWSGSFIMVGYFVGEEWSRLSTLLHQTLMIGALLVLFALLIGLLVISTRARAE